MTDTYDKAYQEALDEHSSILAKRAKEDKRLAQLEKIIESLAPLCEEADPSQIQAPILVPATASLADACRLALQGYERFLMPAAIRDILVASGYKRKQSNLLASVHSLCKRFVEKGEVEEQVHDGKKYYRWKKERSYTAHLPVKGPIVIHPRLEAPKKKD